MPAREVRLVFSDVHLILRLSRPTFLFRVVPLHRIPVSNCPSYLLHILFSNVLSPAELANLVILHSRGCA